MVIVCNRSLELFLCKRVNVLLCLAEISEILSIDKPHDWSMDVYTNFLSIFMGSFHGSCRDLVELKHLVIS